MAHRPGPESAPCPTAGHPDLLYWPVLRASLAYRVALRGSGMVDRCKCAVYRDGAARCPASYSGMVRRRAPGAVVMSTSGPPVQEIGISDEDVTRILDQLDDAEGTVKRSERRSSRRYLRGTAMVTIVLHPDSPPVGYRARIRNISHHGVAILSPAAMALGTQLALQLPIGRELSIVEKPAVVRRCRHVEGTIHEIGVEYSS